jgi:ribulose 1,5-bisphosphate synthetase/thiazole synthase
MRSLIIPSFLSTTVWAVATYDYVIVGGGLTGLVVANRLTENPSSTLTALVFCHGEINMN